MRGLIGWIRVDIVKLGYNTVDASKKETSVFNATKTRYSVATKD